MGLDISRVVQLLRAGGHQARAMKGLDIWFPWIFGEDGIVGGAERYAMELARHMASRLPTRLVTFGYRDRRVSSEHLEIVSSVLRGTCVDSGPILSTPGLFSALGDADVVHRHQQHVLMSSAAAAWCRVPWQARVRQRELGGGGWDIPAHVSTDAWFHGQLARERIQPAHLQARAVVVGASHWRRMDPIAFRRQCDCSKGDGLFVGRVLPHKGIDDLIRGLPTGLSLTIAGPRPDRQDANALAALAAHKNVSFEGRPRRHQLVLEYRRALCVVLPSVYRTAGGLETAVRELLGQTLLEGMACEAATVCTDVASMPEIVENGTTGAKFRRTIPMRSASSFRCFTICPSARCDGKAGRRRVLRRFMWDAVVTRCLEPTPRAGSVLPETGRT